MNTKRFSDAMDKIDDKYVNEAISYDINSLLKKINSVKKIIFLAAAIITLLSLCGSVAYELGLFDPWFQRASDHPVETVRSALEGQLKKEYTISLRIVEITIDEAQTEIIRQRYKGSELAISRGWSDEFIEEHFIVVKACYYVEYDHTKTFLDDGYTEQYFYLGENIESERWEIIENTGSLTVGD